MSARAGLGRLMLAALALLATGCQATQVAHDGINFRQALLAMYTDQAMDNLIRARTNQPFVQLEYKDLLVQVTDQYFGELANNQQATDDKQFSVIKPVTGMLTRTLQNTFNVHGSAQRQGQMSFHADPVTNKNDIYELYLSFANNPFLFIVSDKPPKCAVHLKRKDCGRYYWIPVEAAPLFQDLVLKTTFMRGPETMPPGFYDATVSDVTDKKAVNPKLNDVQRGIVHLDKDVPNGDGHMVFFLPNGRKVRLNLLPVRMDADNKPIELGQPTKRLEVRWSLRDDGVTDLDFKNAKVRIYSTDYPPEPSNDNLAEEIRHDVNRIRSSISPILRNPGN